MKNIICINNICKMSKPCIFTLTNLNIQSIKERYNLPKDELQIYGTKEEVEKLNVTKVTDICNNPTVTFIGDTKQKCICTVSMIDLGSNSDVNILRYNCFWCRNPFSNMGIGCPVKFKPPVISFKYSSIISAKDYEILEDGNVSTDNTSTKQISPSYYQTDGVFCSFNCCKSFIDDNSHNPLYKDSNVLITKLFNDIYDRNINMITPAPHWRTINQYGGFININEFRQSFDKLEYQNHGITRNCLQNTQSLGVMFEKKLKF